MPIFEYRCANGHRIERLRKYSARDDESLCWTCAGAPMTRVVSAPHVEPDGVYSYEPNMGSKDAFDRKWEADKAKRR
jgi:putative FmdB family regulatory protein